MSRGILACLVALSASGLVAFVLLRVPADPPGRAAPPPGPRSETVTVDVIDYAPPPDDDIPLSDDLLEDRVPPFNPALVDRRPVEAWKLNASASVLKLDVPLLKPDQESERLVLHPSYAAAVGAARGEVLPSVNLIDGKAKQFDDGLLAALDRAYYLGHGDPMKGHLEMIRRIHARVARGSAAAEYLAAGLYLAGDPAGAPAPAPVIDFLSNEVQSRPIGFYTWDKSLSDCFRVLRFFARPILVAQIPAEIGRVLREDEGLRRDYEKAIRFYAGLANPPLGKTPLDFLDGPPAGPPSLVTLFPPSTSREVELFHRQFPSGLPPGANLMRELVLAIRSGRVDLEPRADSGWYDHQVHALETLLLPERGEESAHLLLTKSYKKRMLAAFQALMTKRRETQIREFVVSQDEYSPTQEAPPVRPRLRVEPGLTYYLRTARSYAYLADFLESTLGEGTLKSLRGLRQGGERAMDLHSELRFMQDLFYGLYLLAAEDIGQEPTCLDADPVSPAAAEKVAADWLARRDSDPDLAVDTRVAVPVHHDPRTGAVRLWMTIGVRLDVVDASYARPPSLRPPGNDGVWKPCLPEKVHAARYLLPVDEFAEVEIGGGRVLDRGELRAACDRLKTRARIVEALR